MGIFIVIFKTELMKYSLIPPFSPAFCRDFMNSLL